MIRAGFFIIHLGLATLVLFFGIKLAAGPIFYGMGEVGQMVTETAGEISPGVELASSGEGEATDPPGKTAASIIRRNLFKVMVDRPPSGPAPGPKIVRPQEQTRLRLTLRGTIAGKRNVGNWAVIEDEAQHTQALYQEGDQVQGAQIKAIVRNRVTLSFNGKEEVLEVTTSESPTGRGTPSSPPPAASKPVPVNLSVNKDHRPPAELIRSLKTRPYMKKGVPAGILVYGIRPGADATAMGLKNGDIINTVNGIPIPDREALEAAARDLDMDADVRFSLSRRGRDLNVTYSGKTQAFILQAAKE